MSRSLGVKNNSTILKVLSKERNLGPKLLSKFCTYFQFTDLEEEYFRDLVKLDQFRTESRLGKLIKRNLQAIKEDSKVRIIDIDQENNGINSIWYFITRVLIEANVIDRQSLKLSRELYCKMGPEITSIVSMLEKENLVTKINGEYVLSNEHLEAVSAKKPLDLKSLHIAYLDMTQKIFAEIEFSGEVLYSSNYTVAITKSDFVQIRNEIASAMRAIVNHYCSEDRTSASGKDVYQLQAQFFPITKN